MRAGQPLILLDNIKGQFASSALETFLTGDHHSDRVLGVSQMVRLPTNVLVLISGNNFVPRGYLWRRIATTRIAPCAPNMANGGVSPWMHGPIAGRTGRS